MTNQDSSREALLVLDSELKVCAANRSFYELFRLAPEECIGENVYELGGRAWDKKLRTMLEAVLKGASKSDNFELIHDEAAAGHGVLWLSAKTLPSSKSAAKTILLSIADLNSERPIEESLAIANQELKTLAELAGRSAHELNNVLTIVRMNAELLAPEMAKQSISVQEVHDIIAAADRAETLTRRLLVASRRYLPQTTGLDRSTEVPRDAGVVPPVAPKTAPSKLKARLPEEAPGKETILLVEDEQALRKIQKRTLTAAGYRVLEASDGVVALSMAAEAVGEIDLVVTDIEMPALGGRGMIDELNELSPGIRVLFMSGYTDNEILRRGIGTAETQFLRKPFTAVALKAAVRKALAKPAPATI